MKYSDIHTDYMQLASKNDDTYHQRNLRSGGSTDHNLLMPFRMLASMALRVGAYVNGLLESTNCGAKMLQGYDVKCAKSGGVIELLHTIQVHTQFSIFLDNRFTDLYNYTPITSNQIDLYSGWMTITFGRYQKFAFSSPILSYHVHCCSRKEMRSRSSTSRKSILIRFGLLLTSLKLLTFIIKQYMTVVHEPGGNGFNSFGVIYLLLPMSALTITVKMSLKDAAMARAIVFDDPQFPDDGSIMNAVRHHSVTAVATSGDGVGVAFLAGLLGVDVEELDGIRVIVPTSLEEPARLKLVSKTEDSFAYVSSLGLSERDLLGDKIRCYQQTSMPLFAAFMGRKGWKKLQTMNPVIVRMVETGTVNEMFRRNGARETAPVRSRSYAALGLTSYIRNLFVGYPLLALVCGLAVVFEMLYRTSQPL